MSRFLKHKLSTLNSDSGMTLMELMVASSLGLMVVAMTLSTTVANKDAYGYDIVRTRLNQNMRSAFDIINTEVRQAGERLPSAFPAIEIVNGASGAPDTLILRRNVLDEIITVCQNITVASDSNIHLATTTAGAPPACVYGSQTTIYNAWRAYRLAEGDASYSVDAYIFDLAAKTGQFFKYNTEANNAGTSTQTINRGTGPWAGAYTAGATAVYMLTEWKFALSTTPGETDLLQLTINEDDDSVKNVVYGVNDIQFRALMQDGTVKTSFTETDSWTLLQAIEVSITGSDRFRGREISTTLTTQLFPRNVLSN